MQKPILLDFSSGVDAVLSDDRWNDNAYIEEYIYPFLMQWARGDATFMLQTSGSTGTPKPIHVTRDQILASCRNTIQFLQIVEGTTALLCLNPKYIAGIMMLARSIVAKLKLWVVEPSSYPLEKIDLPIDFAAMVPMQVEKVLEEKGLDGINGIKKLIIGGAAISNNMESALHHAESEVYSTYGMTETVSHVALRRVGREKAYRLLPNIESKVDERGCLALKGEVSNGEWLQTNDVVELKRGGGFIWKGRHDTVINSGGVKMFPEQIESDLGKALPKLIGRVAITSVPDERLGQMLVCAVEKQVLSLAELKEAMHHLEKFCRPKKVVAVGKIPLTPTEKINRKALSALVSKALPDDWLKLT